MKNTKKKIALNSAKTRTLFLLATFLVFGLLVNNAHAAYVSIPEAVDNFNIAWRNYSDTPWVGETDTAPGVFGGDRAHSGDIGDYQSSTLYGYFVGPGWLTFYISVASEPNYDFLRVYLDSFVSPKFSISGLVHQKGCVMEIPAGVHIVYWQYKKDGSQSWYNDMAWLDLVQYTRASFTITSPSAGVQWLTGAWHTIKWTYDNPYNYGTDPQVQIEVWKGGQFYNLLTYWTSNDGSYDWYIPSGYPNGNNYQIRIWSSMSGNLLHQIEDFSDYFTITDQTIVLATFLTLSLSPNPANPGQTVTLSGTLKTVSGLAPVYPATVKVEYSTNGGASWNFFTNLNTNAAGQFSTSFGAPGVGTYLVRVSYAGSASYGSSSNTQTFTVQTGGKVNTAIVFSFSPNPASPGQTVTLSGTLKTVSANPVYPASVKVEYSTNGGVNWIFGWNLNTNAAGQFSVSFTAPGKGTYLAKVSYAGSTNYNPSSSTQTLTVS